MEQRSNSFEKQPKFVEEKERFGTKVREIFRQAPNEFLLEDKLEDIEYETKEGKVISIKSLLPKGWKMVRSVFLGLDQPMGAIIREKPSFTERNIGFRKLILFQKTNLCQNLSKKKILSEMFSRNLVAFLNLAPFPRLGEKDFS